MTTPFPLLPTTTSGPDTLGKKLNGAEIHKLLAQANLHRMRREWDKATDCCVAVLRAQPANQTAHALLGDIYRDQRKLDDAIQWYGMAVELRPNPADQAKLEQAQQEWERVQAQAALRQRRGYGQAAPVRSKANPELNTGTTNLMGVSPRRWLRGITVTSLAFACIVLIGLIWATLQKNHKTMGSTDATAVKSSLPPPRTNGGLPQHRHDATPTPTQTAQAALGSRPVITGGGGLAPDRTAPTPAPSPVPGSMLPGFSRPAPGAISPSQNLPPAPVQTVRPLSSTGSGMANGPAPVTPPAPPAPSPLTDGLQQARIALDGTRATILLTGPSSLALDNNAHNQETLVRNIYRAARNAFNANAVLLKVSVLVQTQTATAGLAVVLEAEAERNTALAVNPDTDDATQLQNRLASFHWNANPANMPGATQ